MDDWTRGSSITVPILPDADGFLGRECPVAECEQYFKVTPGTGLQGVASCYCPYCGHRGGHDTFFTKEQVEYAQSVAFNRFSGAFLRDLKRLETRPRRRRGLIDISFKVSGRPAPIRHYHEYELETTVVCERCTLRYAVYGVFAFCPDCGAHNSLQILEKNLELADKLLALVEAAPAELVEQLINDALENQVAAFDGFGREACRVQAAKATDPSKVEGLSFQNLTKARERVRKLFRVDLAAAVSPAEWDTVCRSFQKRHLFAHRMGVVDAAYLAATHDPRAVLGRKLKVERGEVESLGQSLRTLGTHLVDALSAKP
jgi:hypothetical protein